MALHVPPERWAEIPSHPATVPEWRRRLGGGAGAIVAVQGAINRGQLRRGADDRYTLTTHGARLWPDDAGANSRAAGAGGDGGRAAGVAESR